jgi:hypothetical protein
MSIGGVFKNLSRALIKFLPGGIFVWYPDRLLSLSQAPSTAITIVRRRDGDVAVLIDAVHLRRFSLPVSQSLPLSCVLQS